MPEAQAPPDCYPLPYVALLPPTLHQTNLPSIRQPDARGYALPKPLPFTLPTYFLPSVLRCRCTTKAVVSTDAVRKAGNVTRTIAAIGGEHQLEKIVLAPDLLRRLRAYANPASGDAGWPNTYRLSAESSPRPDLSDWAEALFGLRAWCSAHHLRNIAPLNDAHSARREVDAQVMQYLSYMLQARYRNRNWGQGPNINDNIDKLPSYPCWGSGHAVATVRSGALDKNRAGVSDNILFFGPEREDIVASIETETWWTHPIEWRDIFLARSDESDIYPWVVGVDNFETALVKQLWGRLIKHNIKFTGWTNLKVIIIAIRISNHEMAISNAMKWDSPELHEILCGFQFAALDQKKWAELNGADLIQQLCPDDERKYGPRYGFPAVLLFSEHVDNDDSDSDAQQAMADGDADGEAQFDRDDAEDDDYDPVD